MSAYVSVRLLDMLLCVICVICIYLALRKNYIAIQKTKIISNFFKKDYANGYIFLNYNFK